MKRTQTKQDATKRIIAYWNKRVEIFGEEKAMLPMALALALNDDANKKALEILFSCVQRSRKMTPDVEFFSPIHLVFPIKVCMIGNP
mmetsp:Transcript_21815/g.32352  ORF Transcript_21815/g.32352 Transcript_21815/m.32352 type:complete len:87 (-) Transcript_21815:607-867(-)